MDDRWELDWSARLAESTAAWQRRRAARRAVQSEFTASRRRGLHARHAMKLAHADLEARQRDVERAMAAADARSRRRSAPSAPPVPSASSVPSAPPVPSPSSAPPASSARSGAPPSPVAPVLIGEPLSGPAAAAPGPRPPGPIVRPAPPPADQAVEPGDPPPAPGRGCAAGETRTPADERSSTGVRVGRAWVSRRGGGRGAWQARRRPGSRRPVRWRGRWAARRPPSRPPPGGARGCPRSP